MVVAGDIQNNSILCMALVTRRRYNSTLDNVMVGSVVASVVASVAAFAAALTAVIWPTVF